VDRRILSKLHKSTAVFAPVPCFETRTAEIQSRCGVANRASVNPAVRTVSLHQGIRITVYDVLEYLVRRAAFLWQMGWTCPRCKHGGRGC